METFGKLRVQLEELVDELSRIAADQINFRKPAENPVIVDVAQELEAIVRHIQTTARDQLHLFEKKSEIIQPEQEALQIIIGTSAETLNTFEEFYRHVEREQTQSQLIKGLTQLLDWTSHLDYAAESVRTLLRLTPKIASQMARLEVLMTKRG